MSSWAGRRWGRRGLQGAAGRGASPHLARYGEQLRRVCARDVDDLLGRSLARAVGAACGVGWWVVQLPACGRQARHAPPGATTGLNSLSSS